MRHPLIRSCFVSRRGPLPRNAPRPALYRLLSDGRDTGATDPLGREVRLGRVEAALFLADEPLPARRLASLAELADATEARRLVQRLQEMYEADGSAFQVEEIAGGYQLLTRPAYHPWLVRFYRETVNLRLSAPAMETLAIIAYRQPIMRAAVEKVRGVQCGEILQQLMERGLIRITGRDPSLGRPVLYGTTKKFLQAFGLNSLAELPEIEQFRSGEKGKL